MCLKRTRLGSGDEWLSPSRYSGVMIPMKHSTIFKSRWFALIWAAGIIWFAVDTAGGDGSADTNGSENATGISDATGAPVDKQQAEDLAKAIDSL